MIKINSNRWVEIAANIGIVAGLVLVGAQMKQAADLQRLRMLHEESRGAVEIELSMLGENAAAVWAKSIQSPRDLSLEERRIMDAYLYIFAEQLRATFLLSQEGLLEQEEWQKRVLIDATYFYGNPYGQAWWRNFRTQSEYPQDLIGLINKELNDDAGTTMRYFDRTLEHLDEIIDGDSASELTD